MLREAEIEELRPRAFAIAYRMLGSVGDAEDVVQEALLRLHNADRSGETISSRRAWLATVVTRLAIDELRSARARRETYVGEWLPEPLVTDDRSGPAVVAERADSLSVAFLVLLETLSPEQRAAFLLHDVFDYDYEKIAEIVGTSPENARQLASRARRHVEERRPRFESSREHRDALASRFIAAAEEGNLAELEKMLADDVVLHGDRGGKAPALARPVRGRVRVARTLRAWALAAEPGGGFTLRPVELNGQPGAVVLDPGGRVISAMALEISGAQIDAVHAMANPDKLGHLGEPADLRSLFESSARRS
jgi:RNA polymerase sigma-70 factor (TIGR02957 family)